MKTIQFAQALDVEVWVTVEVPDDYTEDEVNDFIQEFPMNVTVVVEDENAGGIGVYVHSVDYHGAAEIQGNDSDE